MVRCMWEITLEMQSIESAMACHNRLRILFRPVDNSCAALPSLPLKWRRYRAHPAIFLLLVLGSLFRIETLPIRARYGRVPFRSLPRRRSFHSYGNMCRHHTLRSDEFLDLSRGLVR